MDIALAGMSSIILNGSLTNHAFFIKEVATALERQGHKTFYIYQHNQKKLDIGSNKSLYDYLKIPAVRLNARNFESFQFNEYKKYSSAELFEIDKFNLALAGFKSNENIDFLPRLRHHTIRILEAVRRYDEIHTFDRFIFYGSNHLSKILQYYCRKNNKKYVMLEEGYFRPYTTTCDSIGVNFENSLPRDRAFFENVEIDFDKLIQYMLRPIRPIDLTLTKKNFDLFASFLQDNNYYSELKEFSRLKEQFIERYFISFENEPKYDYMKKIHHHDNIKRDENKYIFVPFQLHKDTQTLLYSPWIKNTRDLVKTVIEAVKRYNHTYGDSLKVIFKSHPLQATDVDFNESEIQEICSKYSFVKYLATGNTKELIQNAVAVITINSTVGIEALIELKPVITLGNAFYNIEGIVKHCSDPADLPEYIKDSIRNPLNIDLILKFLYYLRFYYFLELDYRAPNKETMSNFLNRVLQ